MPGCEVLIPIKALDTPFTYALQPGMQVNPGALVAVPFGKRTVAGYVLKLLATPDPELALKPITAVLWDEPERSGEIMALAQWLQERYGCSRLQALSTILPPNVLATNLNPNPGLQTPAQVRPYYPDSAAPWYRSYEALSSSPGATVLLDYGERPGWQDLYLTLTLEALAQSRNVLILMPEICLTRAQLEFFRQHLGSALGILHSKLSASARALEWHNIKQGMRQVVLGSRSAVFAPLSHLGVIIMHNEEDPAYKESTQPRYHSRPVAGWRAAYSQAKVILNSCTPAVESYYWALHGKYHYVPCVIPPQAKLKIVEYFREIKRAEIPALGRYLKFKMTKALQERHKVLLFLNRKGFATLVRCKECAAVALCPQCQAPLRLWRQGSELICPLCGQKVTGLDTCPQCRGHWFTYAGIGLEKVEQEVHQVFPQAQVLRWDKESAPKATAWRDADVIIGTQIILPYMDFSSLGVIGVISADTWLNLPNFRGAEFMWQNLGALSFRARPESELVIQSFNTGHFVLQALQRADSGYYYRVELKQRQELQFPPFAHLMTLSFKGPARELALQAAQALQASQHWTLSGPVRDRAPAEEWTLTLKGKKIPLMIAAVNSFLKTVRLPDKVKFILDVDPL